MVILVDDYSQTVLVWPDELRDEMARVTEILNVNFMSLRLTSNFSSKTSNTWRQLTRCFTESVIAGILSLFFGLLRAFFHQNCCLFKYFIAFVIPLWQGLVPLSVHKWLIVFRMIFGGRFIVHYHLRIQFHLDPSQLSRGYPRFKLCYGIIYHWLLFHWWYDLWCGASCNKSILIYGSYLGAFIVLKNG